MPTHDIINNRTEKLIDHLNASQGPNQGRISTLHGRVKHKRHI